MGRTLRELLNKGIARLEEAGVPDPRFDARALLMSAFSIDHAYYLMHSTEALACLKKMPREIGEAEERYEELLKRREKREPLQQIFGVTGFYGLEYIVNTDVLCPRQDTEVLVEAVLQDMHRGNVKTGNDAALLDMCTGSGCIALTLAEYGNMGIILGTDISEAALGIAGRNREYILKSQAERVQLIQSDMFSGVRAWMDARGLSGFDVITSNPPYIPSAVVEKLEPEVRLYEPCIALDGDRDGLRFYRILAEESRQYLLPGGRIYLEIGYDQGETVPEILQRWGYQNIQVIRDFGGQNRVVTAVFNE